MSQHGKVQQQAPVPGVAEGPHLISKSNAADFTVPPPDVPSAAMEGVLWVPSERVHIASVNLPLASHAGRLKALPYAIEPLLGEAPEDVHVALGPAVAGADYVAAALSFQTMQAYADRAGKTARLVPDVFMLPVPPPETWNAGEMAQRVLVRTPDGAGFACSKEAFGVFYEAAGRPVCHLMFGAPEGLPGMMSEPEASWTGQTTLLDLRQGAFAAGRQAQESRVVLQIQIAAAALAIFTFATAAEVWVVQGAADQQNERLSADLAAKFPGLPATDGALETIERLSAGLTQANESGFVAVLSIAATAFEPGGGMALQRAEFDARASRLVLSLEAGSVQGLYDYVGRLETSGLVASVENVEAIPGGAEGLVSISAAGGSP
jgi:general secretion pathway protein L